MVAMFYKVRRFFLNPTISKILRFGGNVFQRGKQWFDITSSHYPQMKSPAPTLRTGSFSDPHRPNASRGNATQVWASAKTLRPNSHFLSVWPQTCWFGSLFDEVGFRLHAFDLVSVRVCAFPTCHLGCHRPPAHPYMYPSVASASLLLSPDVRFKEPSKLGKITEFLTELARFREYNTSSCDLLVSRKETSLPFLGYISLVRVYETDVCAKLPSPPLPSCYPTLCWHLCDWFWACIT